MVGEEEEEEESNCIALARLLSGGYFWKKFWTGRVCSFVRFRPDNNNRIANIFSLIWLIFVFLSLTKQRFLFIIFVTFRCLRFLSIYNRKIE